MGRHIRNCQSNGGILSEILDVSRPDRGLEISLIGCNNCAILQHFRCSRNLPSKAVIIMIFQDVPVSPDCDSPDGHNHAIYSCQCLKPIVT